MSSDTSGFSRLIRKEITTGGMFDANGSPLARDNKKVGLLNICHKACPAWLLIIDTVTQNHSQNAGFSTSFKKLGKNREDPG
jgi:hypothetical protein